MTPGWAAAAVPFEVELSFEGLFDLLDGLAQRLEQSRARPFGLVVGGRSEELDSRVDQVGFEAWP